MDNKVAVHPDAIKFLDISLKNLEQLDVDIDVLTIRRFANAVKQKGLLENPPSVDDGLLIAIDTIAFYLVFSPEHYDSCLELLKAKNLPDASDIDSWYEKIEPIKETIEAEHTNNLQDFRRRQKDYIQKLKERRAEIVPKKGINLTLMSAELKKAGNINSKGRAPDGGINVYTGPVKAEGDVGDINSDHIIGGL